MVSIDERFAATSRGGILYDAARLRKPGEELFERDHWRARGELEEIAGGRASIAVLRAGDQCWVLRHYLRGGWIANLSRDRYFWPGESRTRPFAEWRLLAELRRRDLPVPAPIAARYVRGALTYRADLITEYLPSCRTLADSITGAVLPADHWSAIGTTIAAFHAQGVQHADLNAGNILLSSGTDASGLPRVRLLDFDRGRIRARGSWEGGVLARLHRSLEKLKRQRQDVGFGQSEWQWLMGAYEKADGG